MSIVLNTNINSVFAGAAVSQTNVDLSKQMEALSTGKRINFASDDSAGSTVVSRMAGQIAGLNQDVKNANDGISLGQTYDAAAQTISNILTRMQTLATQIASGTYNTADATNANQEFGQLQSEITRIASHTKWNGSTAIGAATTFTIQVGYTSGDTISLKLGALSAKALGSSATNGSVNSASISTQADASKALSSLSAGLSSLNSNRAVAGAVVNRLQDTVTVLMNLSQRTQEAQSQIQSTDYAATSSALAKDNVLLQAGTAMLAQANQQPQYILTLLK
jgi:flagellin